MRNEGHFSLSSSRACWERKGLQRPVQKKLQWNLTASRHFFEAFEKLSLFSSISVRILVGEIHGQVEKCIKPSKL